MVAEELLPMIPPDPTPMAPVEAHPVMVQSSPLKKFWPIHPPETVEALDPTTMISRMVQRVFPMFCTSPGYCVEETRTVCEPPSKVTLSPPTIKYWDGDVRVISSRNDTRVEAGTVTGHDMVPTLAAVMSIFGGLTAILKEVIFLWPMLEEECTSTWYSPVSLKEEKLRTPLLGSIETPALGGRVGLME
jgi:hypothetical protein